MNSMEKNPTSKSLAELCLNHNKVNNILDSRPLSLTTAELFLNERKRNTISGCYNVFSVKDKYQYPEFLLSSISKVPVTSAAPKGTLYTESTEGIHLTHSLNATQDHAVRSLLYEPSAISHDTLRFLIQNEKSKRIAQLNEIIQSFKVGVAAGSLNYLASIEMQRRHFLLRNILLQDLLQKNPDKQTNCATREDLRAANACVSLKNCKQEVERVCDDHDVNLHSSDSSGTEIETDCKSIPSYQSNKIVRKSKPFKKIYESKYRTKFHQTQSALNSDQDSKSTSNDTCIVPFKTKATDSVQVLDIATSSDLKIQDHCKVSWNQSEKSCRNDGQALSLKEERVVFSSGKKVIENVKRCHDDLEYGKEAMKLSKESNMNPRKQKKGKRPPDMPRRPLSAYNFFFSEERQSVLQSIPNEHPKTTESVLKSVGRTSDEITSLASKSLVKDSKMSDIPAKHTALLNTERLLSLGHNSRYVRRPHRKTHGKIGFRPLAKLIGERWRSLPQTKKTYYQRLASIDLKRYKEQMAAYNAQKKETVEKKA